MRQWVDRTAFWIGLYLAFGATFAAIRLTTHQSVGGDEAESFLWSLDLAWGYGVQPPLYAWLQWGLNQVFGATVLSVAVMRCLCISGIYAAGFLLARRFAGVAVSGMAALTLALVPEISQTFLRTRTHNVLAVALVMVAVWAFLRALEGGRRRDHALFGAMAALAVLAKATAAVFPLGMILAALTIPGARAALLRPRALIGLGVFMLLIAGPALWSWQNFALATASTAKFEVTGDRLGGFLRSLRALVDAFGFAAVAIGIGWVLTRGAVEASVERRIVWRAGAIALALTLAGVLVAGATEVKERWMVAVLVPMVPVVAAAVLQRNGWARYLAPALGALAAVVALGNVTGRYLRAPDSGYAAYAPLADALAARGPGLILASKNIAASLVLSRPDLRARERVDAGPFPCAGDVILLRPASEPDDRADFLARLGPCRVTVREDTTLPQAPPLPPLQLLHLSLTPAP